MFLSYHIHGSGTDGQPENTKSPAAAVAGVEALKGYLCVSLIHGLTQRETVLDSLSEIKLADR